MMRVGVVTGSVSPLAGGLYTSVRRQSQEVAALGVTVGVFALADAQTEASRPAWAPLAPEVFPRNWPAALGRSPALAAAVVAFRPDAIHMNGLWLYLSAHVDAVRVPTVVSPRGMLDPWALRHRSARKRLAWWGYERAALRRAGCVIALCRSEADSVRAVLPHARVAVIPNGIDLPTPSVEQAARAAPAPWGDVGVRPVMLFVGRLHPKKGLPRLLAAWAGRRLDMKDWVLAVAGWGDGRHAAELTALVADAGLTAAVRLLSPLHGPVKDAAFAQAAAFVLPSYSEGLPVAVLEAWAWGCPALLTDACNLPEGFATGAAWRLPDDPAGMADALVGFARLSPPERAAIGDRGRRLASERFTWPQIGRDTRAVYDWLVGGGPPPAVVESRGRG